MNKDFIKLAVAGLMVGACISILMASSSIDDEEIAMSQCSEDEDDEDNCIDICEIIDRSDKSEPKCDRKSAAQKVREGL